MMRIEISAAADAAISAGVPEDSRLEAPEPRLLPLAGRRKSAEGAEAAR